MQFILSILFLITLCFNYQPTSNSITFEELCIRNKAQVDLIQTLHCRVVSQNNFTFSNGTTSSTKQEGEFWFAPGQIKAKISDGKFLKEYTWKKSILRVFSTTTEPGTNNPLYSTYSSSTPTRHIDTMDPFIAGILVVTPPESLNGTPLSQVLNESVVVKKIEKKTETKTTQIILTLNFKPNSGIGRREDWTAELYFDPSVNYLIKKAVYIHNKSGFRRIEEVTSFKEHPNGVFFPESILNRAFNGERLVRSTTTSFNNVRTNEDIQSEFFNIQYKQGVLLFDNINRTTYHVDENGDPITDPIPQGRKEIPPPSNNSTNTVIKFPTQKETISFTWWIFPISSLLAVLCSIWIYFQKKSGVG
jgi:hypothetical protein